jgi:hypothetical protein
MVDMQPSVEAEAIVNSVGERENICLKGYIVKSSSPDLVKFIPSIENPRRYFLIPKVDIYHKIEIDLFPLGKGHMIWAFHKNIQLVEPGKPLYGKPIERVKVQGVLCPNCKFLNKPGTVKCEQCGLDPMQ